MKANQASLKRDDEAVSPIIAVILMVAITVVLAATVFVLVSDIGSKHAGVAMTLGMSQDVATSRLGVNQASAGANWNNVAIKADKTGVSFALNSETSGAPPETAVSTSGTPAATTSTAISAGDFLDLCGTATQVTIALVDSAANSALGSWVFTALPAC